MKNVRWLTFTTISLKNFVHCQLATKNSNYLNEEIFIVCKPSKKYEWSPYLRPQEGKGTGPKQTLYKKTLIFPIIGMSALSKTPNEWYKF